MPVFIGTLLAWLGTALGRQLADTALLYIAMRSLLITLITVTLPIVLKNIISWLINLLMSIVQTVVPDGGIGDNIVSVTGFTAWLFDTMMLPQCVAIIITGIAIRITLNFVPFVG